MAFSFITPKEHLLRCFQGNLEKYSKSLEDYDAESI
jgi:hypothetical protein